MSTSFPLILVVEDDRDLRESTEDLLRDEGYEVISAAHGLDALRYLATAAPPSLILLDIRMPVMDGWQFLTRLRQDEKLGRIPVIVFSAELDAVRLAGPFGVVAVLIKPAQVDELLAVIRCQCTPVVQKPSSS